ncbi:MAG: hypothetical protein OEM24_01005 [Paracoccaceae bacterium]|nr:hypothetical protein [Paracoccaceae bacterium]
MEALAIILVMYLHFVPYLLPLFARTWKSWLQLSALALVFPAIAAWIALQVAEYRYEGFGFLAYFVGIFAVVGVVTRAVTLGLEWFGYGRPDSLWVEILVGIYLAAFFLINTSPSPF